MPPLFSIKKPGKWDVMSFVNNVQYGEEGVREYGDPATKLEEANSFLGASFMFLTRTKFQYWNAVYKAKT